MGLDSATTGMESSRDEESSALSFGPFFETSTMISSADFHCVTWKADDASSEDSSEVYSDT